MGKLFYTQKFAKKRFRGEDVKDAYMKACKWYASNVIAKDKLHHIQVEYIKEKDNSVTMVLYASLPEEEAMEHHCQCCKEMHHAFFINEDTACNRCSAAGYQRRLVEHLSVKIDYYKQLLRRIIDED